MIQKLADSAQDRADRAGVKAQGKKDALVNADTWEVHTLLREYHGFLNDYFYWIGHANAYRGVLAGLEIMGIVEEELDAEGSCP